MIKYFSTVHDFIDLLPRGRVALKEISNLFTQEVSLLNRITSSYKKNDFHLLFFSLTRLLKPTICLELGVLSGFSLISMALGVKLNGYGNVLGVDLFEDYPYNNAYFFNVQETIKKTGVNKICNITKALAKGYTFGDMVPDLLHVDLSNDGDIFCKYFESYKKHVKLCMIFEGGSLERDKVEWMQKYSHSQIAPVVHRKLQTSTFDSIIITAFPSMTIIFQSGILERLLRY